MSGIIGGAGSKSGVIGNTERPALKTYIGGQDLSPRQGGDDFDVSMTGTPNACWRCIAIPYQTVDGVWWLRFQIGIQTSQTATTTKTLTISGITFAGASSYYNQVCIGNERAGQTTPTTAITQNGAATIIATFGNALVTTVHWAGDVELASKPTWAD